MLSLRGIPIVSEFILSAIEGWQSQSGGDSLPLEISRIKYETWLRLARNNK